MSNDFRLNSYLARIGFGGTVGPDFATLAANLGRNLMEGRLGVLTAVFEAAPI